MALAAAALGAVTCVADCAAVSAPDNPAGVRLVDGSRVGSWRGAGLPQPYSMPDVTLTTDEGRPFNLVRDTTRRVTLVFFGYTNCPDVCPLVMSDLTATYLRLPADVRAQTQVLFVTTDPRRDTGSVLRAYLARYDPAFVGLRASLPTVKVAARAMGVAITGIERLPSGGYDVGHSSQVIGFRGNRAPVIWTPGTPVADMVADVTQLAGDR